MPANSGVGPAGRPVPAGRPAGERFRGSEDDSRGPTVRNDSWWPTRLLVATLVMKLREPLERGCSWLPKSSSPTSAVPTPVRDYYIRAESFSVGLLGPRCGPWSRQRIVYSGVRGSGLLLNARRTALGHVTHFVQEGERVPHPPRGPSRSASRTLRSMGTAHTWALWGGTTSGRCAKREGPTPPGTCDSAPEPPISPASRTCRR